MLSSPRPMSGLRPDRLRHAGRNEFDVMINRPQRREAARWHSGTKGPKTKNHATDDDCTNERPNNYFEPSAAFNQVAKSVASNAAEHSADYSRDL
jgi:hypothetical protein